MPLLSPSRPRFSRPAPPAVVRLLKTGLMPLQAALGVDDVERMSVHELVGYAAIGAEKTPRDARRVCGHVGIGHGTPVAALSAGRRRELIDAALLYLAPASTAASAAESAA